MFTFSLLLREMCVSLPRMMDWSISVNWYFFKKKHLCMLHLTISKMEA